MLTVDPRNSYEFEHGHHYERESGAVPIEQSHDVDASLSEQAGTHYKYTMQPRSI